MTVLGGITPHFGSKREMAPQIVAHFGDHDQYFEVFGGSLACLLAKTPCRHEIVSEKNPDVANLIRCLNHEKSARELWWLSSIVVISETAFYHAAERLSQDWSFDPARPTPSRAFDFLLVSWQGPSGLAGTTRKPRFAVRNTASGGTVAARWRAVAESIPEWHERLRNVEFRCRDAFELIAAMPDREGTVAYIDPPYTFDGRTAGRYQFDFTDADHDTLSRKLSGFTKTKVLVSLYDTPEANRLYAGWRKVSITAPRKMKHVTGGEQEHVSAGEVLLINM